MYLVNAEMPILQNRNLQQEKLRTNRKTNLDSKKSNLHNVEATRLLIEASTSKNNLEASSNKNNWNSMSYIYVKLV